MKLHGGPNLARGPEFDTHDLQASVDNLQIFVTISQLLETPISICKFL